MLQVAGVCLLFEQTAGIKGTLQVNSPSFDAHVLSCPDRHVLHKYVAAARCTLQTARGHSAPLLPFPPFSLLAWG